VALACAAVASPVRDVMRLQAGALNPRSDLRVLYPVLPSGMAEVVRLHEIPSTAPFSLPPYVVVHTLSGAPTPRTFAVRCAAASLPLRDQELNTAERQAHLETVRALARDFPDEQPAAVAWVVTEMASLPRWPEWYRPELTRDWGERPGHAPRLLTEREVAPARAAIEAARRRFPETGFWDLEEASVELCLGRDAAARAAIRRALTRPHLTRALPLASKASFEAGRAAGLPAFEALFVLTRFRPRGGASNGDLRSLGFSLQELGDRAAVAGRGREAAEYWLLESDLGERLRADSQSRLDMVVGITLAAKGAGWVAESVPDAEAKGREPLPDAARLPASAPGHVWVKGPHYDVVLRAAGLRAVHRLLNHADAARRGAEALRRAFKRQLPGRWLDSALLLLPGLTLASIVLLLLFGSFLLLSLITELLWRRLRRPQGGLRWAGQTALILLCVGGAGALVACPVSWDGRTGSGPPALLHLAWAAPIVLVLAVALAALLQARPALAPERGLRRCFVGSLHQVLPNLLFAAAVAYLTLTMSAAVIRQQVVAGALPHRRAEWAGRFQETIGWREADLKPPFPEAAVRSAGPADLR